MSHPSAAPAERFSNRVENYVRHRPGYPPQVMEILRREAGLNARSVVADVGAGTGIFTALLLEEGCVVHAVEPNEAMRTAAEKAFAGRENFHSLAAPAEAIPLPNASVDLIVAAQAFHWFDPAGARREFTRLLHPEGKIALLWNVRRLEATPFLRAYEQLLIRYGTDYQRVRHENIGETQLAAFFQGGVFVRHQMPNEQCLDFEGLKGRLLSSSYAPAPGQPGHEEMLQDLAALFAECAEDGRVGFHYDTELYLGR